MSEEKHLFDHLSHLSRSSWLSDSDQDGGRAKITMQLEKLRPFKLIVSRKRAKRAKPLKSTRHVSVRVAFCRYGYYDIAFKYFVEQALDAEFLPLPEPTRRTLDLGSRNSNDFVCAPFKHTLGDFIEALDLGAEVLVQFSGPCRLGYYGELQESILRDMGYEFDMLNFADMSDKPSTEFISLCKKKINPNISIPHAIRGMLATFRMITYLDSVNDFYLAHAGFELEPGSFDRELASFHNAMRVATSERDINAAWRQGLDALEALPTNKQNSPLRVGIIGEYFTAIDSHANLHIERKLLAMGVELHRMLNVTNRNLRYNEKNLCASIAEYATYDMGPTSTMTIAAALRYAKEGFDGIVHLKSTGCTPEIDCMPILQQISQDTKVPMLFLSYDSQTSDTGLDTRLEAFYDMIAMRKTIR